MTDLVDPTRRRGAPLLRGALTLRPWATPPPNPPPVLAARPAGSPVLTEDPWTDPAHRAPASPARPVPPPPAAEPWTAPVVPAVAAQLSRLAQLAEQGVLSEQEFAMAMARLLRANRLA